MFLRLVNDMKNYKQKIIITLPQKVIKLYKSCFYGYGL